MCARRHVGAIHKSPRRSTLLHRPHAIVPGVVFNFGQPQQFHQRRHVHAKAPPQALLQPVPPAHGIVRGARPGFHRAGRGGLLLVGAAQRQPVAVLLQHGVEVVQAAQVIAQFRRAHHAHQRGRIQRLVAEHAVFRGAAGGR